MVDASSSRTVLSCDGPYTSFSFGGHEIRFRTPKTLVRYVDVREWDKGYLVVNAEYDGCPEPVEEYIDLVPINALLHSGDAAALAAPGAYNPMLT